MAEFVIPELLIGELGAEAAFGAGIGEAAAFGGAEAGLAGGLGEAFGGAAAGEFGLGEAGLGAFGTGGFEAGSSAIEALGGFGFEAPAAAGEAATEASLGTASAGADVAAQTGFVPAGLSENIGSEAIAALNEPTLGSPELTSIADTTDLGSVASSGPVDQLTPVDPGVTAASPETSPLEGGSPAADTVGTETSPSQIKTVGDTPPGTDAAQPAGQSAARAASQTAGAGAGGKFSANPMSLLQAMNMFKGQPSSPYLGQGAGYANSLGAFGQQQINQYNSGTLRPEDLAQIMVQQKAALNKMRQFYAQSGNSKSTAAIQAESQIMQQSVALQKQFFDQYLQSGMKALGDASSGLINAARTDLQSQQSYNDSLTRATSAMSRAFTFSGSGGGGGEG